MADITVKEAKSDKEHFEYEVLVREGGSETKHVVGVKKGYYLELTGGKIPPDELVKKSFEFLLEREPKESILGRFDLPVIARYFPEYPGLIKNRF